MIQIPDDDPINELDKKLSSIKPEQEIPPAIQKELDIQAEKKGGFLASIDIEAIVTVLACAIVGREIGLVYEFGYGSWCGLLAGLIYERYDRDFIIYILGFTIMGTSLGLIGIPNGFWIGLVVGMLYVRR